MLRNDNRVLRIQAAEDYNIEKGNHTQLRITSAGTKGWLQDDWSL